VRRPVKLPRIPSAAKSPWSWPIAPLAAVAAAGQWGGVTMAEVAAAVCGAIGVGVVIGLTVADGRGSALRVDRAVSDKNSFKTGAATTSPSGESATKSVASRRDSPRAVDLRGARLVDAVLVHADLRQADLRHADLRGAILTGADLSGADLTGARLGPLDENPQSDVPACHLVHPSIGDPVMRNSAIPACLPCCPAAELASGPEPRRLRGSERHGRVD
jgi:hypothetical protein